MPYIGPDGNVTDRRSRFRLSIISDVFFGIVDAVLIFFRTVTQPPSMIANGSRRTTYAQRNGISNSGGNNRGNSNVRGVRNLGPARAMPGGG